MNTQMQDSDMMYELSRQFVECLTGNESKDELQKMIDEFVANIKLQSYYIDEECIRTQIAYEIASKEYNKWIAQDEVQD